MKREIATTQDGSKTLYISEMSEGYHSGHGALQEAKHVFINNGLNLINDYEISILEMGFGTGLNFLVTIDEYLRTDKNHILNYFSIEKYPVSEDEISQLDYPSLFDNEKIKEINTKIHAADWNTEIQILDKVFLTKFRADFFELEKLCFPPVNLVYYDCFGARVQPDLWEMPLFKMVAEKMQPGGLLTTYSSKGSVRRILQELGLTVEKKPGPPGKREMINARKNLIQ